MPALYAGERGTLGECRWVLPPSRVRTAPARGLCCSPSGASAPGSAAFLGLDTFVLGTLLIGVGVAQLLGELGALADEEQLGRDHRIGEAHLLDGDAPLIPRGRCSTVRLIDAQGLPH
jgi:hypothetical protein